MPCAMYRSVGKLSMSLTITERSGRSFSAALSSLNRLTLMLSQAITSSARAPISRAILAPTLTGRSIQSCVFQLRIKSVPHSSVIARCTRSGT